MMKKNLTKFIPLVLFLVLSACSTGNNPRHPVMANTEQSSHPGPTPDIKIENKAENNKEDQKKLPAPDMKNCICVQLWMPVCGDNGKTYSNACFAKCAHVTFKQGSCTKLLTD